MMKYLHASPVLGMLHPVGCQQRLNLESPKEMLANSSKQGQDADTWRQKLSYISGFAEQRKKHSDDLHAASDEEAHADLEGVP